MYRDRYVLLQRNLRNHTASVSFKYPEDGGNWLLQNVRTYLPNYTAL
jgi:hypothetical protein